MGIENEITIIEHSNNNTRQILKTDSIVDATIDKFIDRSRVGKLKYNTDLDREDLSLEEWIDHSIEEAMDLILYLQKIKQVIGGKKTNRN
jgi:hypothetical protein